MKISSRISKYFGEPYTEIPIEWGEHPRKVPETNISYQVKGFLQHNTYPECFIGILDFGPDIEFFFCTKCHTWKKVGTTISHIKMHYNTISHNDEIFEKNNGISRKWQKKLTNSIELFILINGYPFRCIEDKNLKVIPGLCTRKFLQSKSRKIANKVRGVLKNMLIRCDYCSLSIDEWCDLTKKRFLGVSCHTKLEGQMKALTISHISLDKVIARDGRDHLVADDICGITNSIIEGYSISDKVILIVTDRAQIMKSGIQKLNDLRSQQGKPLIIWGNCVCHAFNSLLTFFIKEIKPLISPIFNLQKKLNYSEIFASFLIRKESKISRISSYNEVRWYSLFKMLSHMQKLKDEIIEFMQTEFQEIVSIEIWNNIENIMSIVQIVKRTTKALEGENYTTISYVLQAFHSIYSCFSDLSKKGKTYLEAFQKWQTYYNQVLTETKNNWSPLLEVACFLHPGLNHEVLLNHYDMELIFNFFANENGKWSCITQNSAILQLSNSNPKSKKVNTYYSLDIKDIDISIKKKKEKKDDVKDDALFEMMSLVKDDENLQTENENRTIYEEINVYKAQCIIGKYMPNQFWKEKSFQLPKLAEIANKIMSIIPSSASTERQFSCSKRIQGLRRAHMCDDVFEDQVLIASNPEITEQVYNILNDENK